MSIFDTQKNKTICVLPWVHEFKTIDGKTGPCCYGDTLRQGESMETVRKEMLEGTQPRACANCLRGESESGHSPRIRETLNWINKFGEPDVNNPHTQYLDIRYDPTCNLKCKDRKSVV